MSENSQGTYVASGSKHVADNSLAVAKEALMLCQTSLDYTLSASGSKREIRIIGLPKQFEMPVIEFRWLLTNETGKTGS